MGILLIMPLTSCATKIKTETETIIPELVFPIMPDLSDYEHKRIKEGVIVSNEYIVDMAKYKILIEETEKTYNDLKELYNETK